MAKGSNAEREVSKLLSLWWTNGKRDDCIWRTAGSGARFTTRAKMGKDTAGSAGDFTFIDSIAKPLFNLLLIENKIGYNKIIDVLCAVDSITQKNDVLLTWFEKAQLECRKAGRFFAIVIFKRDRKQRCVAIPTALFNSISSIRKSKDMSRMYLMPQRMVIVSLIDFLDWCSPNDIMKVLEEVENE